MGPTLLEKAQILYRQRRLRARYFIASRFAEPEWDILLDLFIADGERRRISVTSVCIGADVPMTTALRHLQRLQDQRLVERLRHPRDDRSSYVRLTEGAILAMELYLADI